MEWRPPNLLPPCRLFVWQLEIAKRLLSEDTSVSGRGVYTVLGISNTIANLHRGFEETLFDFSIKVDNTVSHLDPGFLLIFA
ncbi:hypothetical protein QYE76_026477 [Lolium multiflorum]|uniref:Uncharacterized protein n=1 Tax=Lolium multiflorum TaxID=4521 RepID=A0AAD8VXL5_LOLMU|nr:hypothetical protein QYE76_026477 [Lolium multiflorum]